MPLFTVDSNNVLGMSVQEAGLYNVKIIIAEVGKTGRNQQKITIDYEIIDGKYQGATIPYQVLTWNDESSDSLRKSERRFNTFVIALGASSGTVIDSLQSIANIAVNRTLSVDTEWGQPNNKGNIYLNAYNYHPVNPKGSQPNGVKRPDQNQPDSSTQPTGSTNSTPSGSTSDPFSNSGDSINVSDDDLPF
ncbi:DUF669 domain-containing protein [Lentilactobacillus parabuchneri]|uniref:DUF669 domain-containing protein n=1 Tax=Lentilactobacillus parabuchneri TaxID=152331 RepID=UPI002306E6AA|nr:DUF669 domain-containing protein [Lentilactobacillus parabuchneri]MDB1103668.1 DUF669 domain-containing protein [Lentilactobacillus parabuchneri]